jgi:hypothetical protein
MFSGLRILRQEPAVPALASTRVLISSVSTMVSTGTRPRFQIFWILSTERARIKIVCHSEKILPNSSNSRGALNYALVNQNQPVCIAPVNPSSVRAHRRKIAEAFDPAVSQPFLSRFSTRMDKKGGLPNMKLYTFSSIQGFQIYCYL